MSALVRVPARAVRSLRSDAALVGIYAAAFAGLHTLAAAWGQLSIYSLWYPIAGVRFAMLWRFGPRYAPVFAAAELLIHLAWGHLDRPPLQALSFAASVVFPTCAYGVAIAAVQAAERRAGPRADAAMPLAVAMAVAPAMAALSSFPWHLLDEGPNALHTLMQSLSALVVFVVGDVLGVLILAPPLLWAFGLADRRVGEPLRRLTRGRLIEAAAAFALAAIVPFITARTGLGVRLEPMLLAAVWVGLRLGTAAAWLVLAPVSAFVLFFSPPDLAPSVRMGLHMLIASVAVAGYAAGSYSDANARHLREISRRDRLLFHADRLKTLRAMSVAIIHELAQPLSILAVEARNLREISRAPVIDHAELSAAAALIERKSTGLAELARRLRAFGARGAQATAGVDLDGLLQEVADIVRPEAKAAGVRLRLEPRSEARVTGHAVELQQVIVNLLRNAILAAPGEEVLALSRRTTAEAVIEIDNPVRAAGEDPAGMGLGLIIARSIVEAHGGELTREPLPAGVRHTVRLPLEAVDVR